MLALLCKKLGRNPSFLRNIDRNASPVRRFFSTEAQTLDSGNEDGGKGILSSLNINPSSSSSSPSVAGAEVTIETLLRSYGFTDAHLSRLHTLRPHFFTFVDAHKTLLPKLEFYRGLGLSNTDLPKIACSRLITGSIEKTIAPNVAALRQAGVPHSRILHLLRIFPAALGYTSLPEYLKEVTEMGFNPKKTSFFHALKVFGGTSKLTRDKKMEVYRKFGMTDEEILRTFRLFPLCMTLSEGNIVQTMDFVVKKMGWQPGDVARFPALLSCSLEKRTIPRCTVVRYLQGKGFLRKNISLCSFLAITEEDFVDKFVKKYEDDVPALMDIYLAIKISPPPPLQEQILS